MTHQPSRPDSDSPWSTDLLVEDARCDAARAGCHGTQDGRRLNKAAFTLKRGTDFFAEATGTGELPVVRDMVLAVQLTAHGGHGDRGPGSGRRRGRPGGGAADVAEAVRLLSSRSQVR